MSIISAVHTLALPCTEENPQSNELVENEDSHTLCKLCVCVWHVCYFVPGECLLKNLILWPFCRLAVFYGVLWYFSHWITCCGSGCGRGQ